MSIQPRSVILSLALSCAAFGPASAAPPADKPAIAPYGRWESPISAAMVAAQGLSLGELMTGDGGIFWVEQRPDEGGRNAIVRYADGKGRDVNPEPFNARNRVHEYGGGDFVVSDGVVFFSNFADQRLYRQEPSGEPVAITPEGSWRFADCTADPGRSRLICVGEDHSGDKEPRNLLVAVPMQGGAVTELAAGSDFVAAPRLDPTGSKLAWIAWDHPNMPWDGTTLWLADLTADGSLKKPVRVAGDASILQPQWAEDGTLFYVSDQSGWWNIHAFDGGKSRAVHDTAADFAFPAWLFNFSSYAVLDDETIVAVMTEKARDRLVRIDRKTGKVEAIDTPFVNIGYLRRLDADSVIFVGTGEREPARIVRLDVASGQSETLKSAGTRDFPEDMVAVARPLEFETAPGEIAHAFYYPPTNPHFTAPTGTRPPLVVSAHGGPTGHNDPAYALAVQFWTSRGFAYLDVNYRGSSGFGREYRNKLKGQWGIVDIEDVVKAARFAADEGLADPEKLIVRGGSAGGFVVLAAHAFHDLFATGANYFGVSDLEALARDTHKFESRYLDSLVGPYPERADLYKARSPINHLDGFTRPLIILQGLDDKIVPPNQSDVIVDALRERGVTVEYLTFEGEGHGFRRPENRIRSLEAELDFYTRVLGI